MRFVRILKVLFLGLMAFLGTMATAYANFAVNMPVGVTPISREIYDLHMTIFWICVAIGAVVFGVMFYSLFAHRKSRGVTPATFHGNLRVEIFWTIIPLLILIIMAIPATLVLIRMEDSSQPDVNIKVTGYQWKWQYEYLDDGISFYSNLATPQDQLSGKAPKGKWYLLEVDKPLVVPIHKKIRFLVTANDVIHSWWVPDLGIKRDAIPGFVHESWARIEKPGIYRGQCAELCGMNHAFMPIVVDARTEADYAKWLQEQKAGQQSDAHALKVELDPHKTWTLNELMQKGEDVYNSHCAACHQPEGQGMPPAFPAIKGSKTATGPVAAHIDTVLQGRPGTAMVSFAQQLDDAEIAAVITYERNAWGNANKNIYGKYAGGIVQPAEVVAAHKKLEEHTK